MTVNDAAGIPGFELLCSSGARERGIKGVYCCDLLSFAMGHAPAGCAWITVMGNVNIAAVGLLADVACIVVAEGVQPDAQTLEKARQNGLPILRSTLPAYETARAIMSVIGT